MGLLLSGCAVLLPDPGREDLPASTLATPALDVPSVPFFPQEVHQCGPAALATVLVQSGAEVSPEQLSREIYLPGRKGTLTPELVAAVRRHGRLPEHLPPRFDALLGALNAGHPVLVLQNLGLSWWPLWHYAVVYGYDAKRGDVLLRSGTLARQALPRFTFEHTWARSGRFAIVVLRADEPPLFTPATDWLHALASSPAPLVAWRTATLTWPAEAGAWFGLGNALYAAQPADLPGAESAWREAIRVDPDLVAAYNNLAQLIAARAQDEALSLIETALRRAHTEAAREALLRTRRDIAAPSVR